MSSRRSSVSRSSLSSRSHASDSPERRIRRERDRNRRHWERTRENSEIDQESVREHSTGRSVDGNLVREQNLHRVDMERARDRDRRAQREYNGIDKSRSRSRSPRESAAQRIKFSLDRKKMKQFRSWMTTPLTPNEAKVLREKFEPSFSDSSFCLQIPEVDGSIARRLKEFSGQELTKAEIREKALKTEQRQILDIARPLLFLWENITKEENIFDQPLVEAIETALRLWGVKFHSATASRRENLLKVSDPKFVSLLSEPSRFKPKQCASLFGRQFIDQMVKEAANDEKLRNIGRKNSSAPYSNQRNAGHSSGYRGQKSSFSEVGEIPEVEISITTHQHHLRIMETATIKKGISV